MAQPELSSAGLVGEVEEVLAGQVGRRMSARWGMMRRIYERWTPCSVVCSSAMGA